MKSRHAAMRLMLWVVLPISAAVCQAATEQEKTADREAKIASFDIGILKSRGLSPRLAEFFKDRPRFLPGAQRVMLRVNDDDRGEVNAQFDRNGALCFNAEFLKQAQLVIPPAVQARSKQEESTPQRPAESASAMPDDAPARCYDYRQAFPEMIVILQPSQQQVKLTVPTQALRPSAAAFNIQHYTRGGTAGLLNYDVLTFIYRYPESKSRYLYLNTLAGFNAGDWIVRSQQTLNISNGKSQFAHLYGYAQRTLIDYNAIVQAGQINVTSSIFPGPAIIGVQIAPEYALLDAQNTGAVVEGAALSPARVEVRQSGALIYSTQIPAGPFSLSALPLINQDDLEVTVIEENGTHNRFTVPALSFSNLWSGRRQGFSAAVGQTRALSSGSHLPRRWLVSAEGSWRVRPDTALAIGFIAQRDYQTIGSRLDVRPARHFSFSVNTQLSSDQQHKLFGIRNTIRLSTQLWKRLSMNMSAAHQSPRYRSQLDALFNRRSGFRNQYSGALAWSNRHTGHIRVTYTRTEPWTHAAARKRWLLTWGKSFRRASLSLNIERESGGLFPSRSVYLRALIPLGKYQINSYLRNSSGQDNPAEAGLTASMSDTLNDYVRYDLSTSIDSQHRVFGYSGALNLLPRYARIGLGHARFERGSTSYSAHVSGGVIAHRNGLTFSPEPIEDTFGIASIGDLSGVKINTPRNTVWTDAWGRAVIPSLPAYGKGEIRVETHSLPRNIDIRNGHRTVKAGRGSVNFVDFEVLKTRRVLLNTVVADGRILAKGSSVHDQNGRFITIVIDKGQIFLDDRASESNTALYVEMFDNERCQLDFKWPEYADPDVYYETANAVCHPVLFQTESRVSDGSLK